MEWSIITALLEVASLRLLAPLVSRDTNFIGRCKKSLMQTRCTELLWKVQLHSAKCTILLVLSDRAAVSAVVLCTAAVSVVRAKHVACH
jgi:hypothetical protein